MNLSFGKYKDKSCNEIFTKDKHYIIWLCDQSWFKEQHNELYNYCMNIKNSEKIKKNDNVFIIYTDGACSNNGMKNPKCSIGVHFSEKNKIKLGDVSERLFVEDPSNNVAELYAILRSFEMVKENNIKISVKLYTDSSYCYKIINEWYDKWIKNNLLDNKKNLDIIERIMKLYKTMDIKLFHVKAHTKNLDEHSIGNRIADQLAKNALRKK